MSEDVVPQGDNGEQGNEGGEFDFAAWLGEQPEHVKSAIEASSAGLHSALKAEREQRKELARQLRDATGKAEEGSALRAQLEDISSKHEAAERKAAFYEAAGRPEIGCANPKAAYLVAQADDLFTRSGEPDWGAIKAAAPELFARKTPPGNAGNGAGTQPVRTGGMNEFIRVSAGRG